MTTQITPDEHSNVVGGSTAARLIGCPASYRLEQLAPPDRGSPYAREGTALHEMMAIILRDDKAPEDLLPFTFTHAEGWSFVVDHALWDDKGAPALAAFDAFLDEQEASEDDEFTMFVETRVAFPGVEGAYGTSDVIGRCGGVVHVIDWKFGRGVVDAEENKQLMFYACAALNTLGPALGRVEDDTPVSLTIIQPACAEARSTWTTTPQRLEDFALDLREAVGAAKQPDAPRAIGPWCRFARCKAICPLHVGAAVALAERASDPQRLRAAPAGGSAGHTKLGETLGELLSLADTVEDWCDSVRVAAMSHAEDGGVVAGYKLVAGRAGARRWAVPDESVVKFFKNRRFLLDDYMPRKLLTAPQGEKLLLHHNKKLPASMIETPPATSRKLVREGSAGTEARTTGASAQALRDAMARLPKA